MKKVYLLLSAVLFGCFFGFAQTSVVIQENFDSYDGTSGTVPSGWNFSYNGNYTSNSSSGIGPNSYKFGADQATIISPMYNVDADSISFWCKQLGSTNPANDSLSCLLFYGSTDGVMYSLIDSLKPVNKSEKQWSYAISPYFRQIKFVYHKVGGNVAFDDFKVIKNGPLGLVPLRQSDIRIFPNPSTNKMVSVDLGANYNCTLSVYNIIGKEIRKVEAKNGGKTLLDLTELEAGNYFVKINNGSDVITRKIVLE